MKATAKFQGTRYVVQLRKTSSGEWSLDLLVNEALEDSKTLRSLSMRNINEGVGEFVKTHNINTNHMITDNLVKKLYQDASGDKNFEEHSKTEQALEMKKNLANDPNFQQSLVSEFNQTFNRQGETIKVDKKDKKEKPPQKPVKTETPKPLDPELKNVVSEMGKMMGEPSPKPRDTPAATHVVPQHIRSAEPQPASVEISEMINQIIEEQTALKSDVDRIYKRMERIDNMMMKLKLAMRS